MKRGTNREGPGMMAVVTLMAALALAAACRPLATSPPVAATTAPVPTATKPEQLPTPTFVETLQLTVDALMNGEYQGIYEEPILLSGGLYEGEPFVEGGSSRPTVAFTGAYSLGDLDGDGVGDAASVLAENSGGSGSFIYLAAVVSRDGKAVNVATTLLGDRVQVHSISIEASEIKVLSKSHGPDDPMCCPSQEVEQVFALRDSKLAEVSRRVIGPSEGGPSAAEAPGVTGTTWQWWALVETEPAARSVVPHPARYTLLLKDDGTVQIKADCNDAGGSFILQDNSLVIEIGPTTMAECGDESLYDQYLALLAAVESHELQDGQLSLQLADGAGTMLFATSPIVGTTWHWSGLLKAEPAAQSAVPNPQDYTLTLAADGTLRVKADCNDVGGSYTLVGDRLSLELGPTTTAECGDDSLERQYVSLLATVESFVLQEGQLHLNLAGDAGSMVFSAPLATFVTWEWRGLIEIDPPSQSVVPEPEGYTLRLAPDGTVRIRADCNDVGGSYVLEGDALRIALGPTTLAECGEASLDQQYLALLANVESYSIEGGQLLLNLAEGAGTMIFQQREAPSQS